MHDSAIKNFCTWARRELISEVKRRCSLYGISDHPENPKDAQAVNGKVLSLEERRQRESLLQKIKDEGYDCLVERVAYTWFNRIMAIRFMEVNDRLPSRTRLLSGNDGSFKPQAITEALQVDIEGIDRAKVAQLVQAGDDEETFRYLFLAQCAELAECMSDVFERVGSDMELLLPDGLLRAGGVIERMVESIPEKDWREGVEIVGWMYQYYVSERKDEYFASKRKATREDLPPATQLFTPEWIVRYLTENSLGRLWMLNHPDSELANRMEYYIAPDGDAEADFKRIASPEDITVVDPACGSGHILVYAFDLIAAMYEEEGYSRRDIPRLVLEKNITGLEIDPRAAAMASFALIMKACEYDSRFLRRSVHPRITVLSRIEFSEEERGIIARTMKKHEHLDAPFLLEQTDLLDVLEHLDEAGSLFAPTETDLASLRAVAAMDEASMFGISAAEKVQQALDELEPLSQRYDVVVANPPYLGSGNMNPWLSKWTKKNHPDGKADLFAAFICRGFSLADECGYSAMVTMQSWMFLSSFENLRKNIIETRTIINMAHLGARAFDAISGEVVQTTATILLNNQQDARGGYVRLVDPLGEAAKSAALREAVDNSDCGWFYRADQQDFKKIPGSPIAYWASTNALELYDKAVPTGDIVYVKKGMFTGDNARFIRAWYEVSHNDLYIGITNKDYVPKGGFVPINSGGTFRRWYGNRRMILAFDEINYQAISDNKGHRNPKFYFHEAGSWTKVTTGSYSIRWSEPGFINNDASMAVFENSRPLILAIALLNSEIAQYFLRLVNESLNYTSGDVASVPFFIPETNVKDIEVLSKECISLSKSDWDFYETSWDFTRHPMIPPINGGKSDE